MSPNDKKCQNANGINACDTDADSNLPNRPMLELSMKSVLKSADKEKSDKSQYFIICNACDDCKIVNQFWAKGKRNLHYFAEKSAHANAFEGTRFGVRHSGTYTVYVKDEKGRSTVETITINQNKVLILVIPFLFILAGAATLGILNYMHIIKLPIPIFQKLDNNGQASSGSYNGMTKDQILDELKKQQIMITDNVSSSINFLSGKNGSDGSWVVKNIQSNKVIMQAEIFLNGNRVAESVPIKPGEYIQSIKLSQDVPKGTYSVVAYINYYTTDTQTYISKAGYKVKMTVKN